MGDNATGGGRGVDSTPSKDKTPPSNRKEKGGDSGKKSSQHTPNKKTSGSNSTPNSSSKGSSKQQSQATENISSTSSDADLMARFNKLKNKLN